MKKRSGTFSWFFAMCIFFSSLPLAKATPSVSSSEIDALRASSARVRFILGEKERFQQLYPLFFDVFDSLANRAIVAEFFPNRMPFVPMPLIIVGPAGSRHFKNGFYK